MHRVDSMSSELSERLLGNQESFHSQVKVAYTDLAATVDQSLKESMQRSAQVAGESMLPALQDALAGMARETQSMHERLVSTWTGSLSQHEQQQAQWVGQVSTSLSTFAQTVDQRSQTLVSEVRDAQARHLAVHGAACPSVLVQGNRAADGRACP